MSTTCIAFCWASGLIQFGTRLREGAIEIARGRKSIVRREITATARLSYDSKTLLVPGVPEATNQAEAAAMLMIHCRWLKQRERDGFIVNARKPLPKAPGAVRRLVAKARAKATLRACRDCGCTETRACPGGCSWVEEDLCSSCAAIDHARCA